MLSRNLIRVTRLANPARRLVPQVGITLARSLHTSLKALNAPSAAKTDGKLEAKSPEAKALSIPDLTPLKYEEKLYATIKIHEIPYLVTEGDVVILPFRMKHAEVGDELQFTDIVTLGSRDYTYNVNEGMDKSAVSIKGVVLEKTKSPMYVKEITKRRNRHVRHVQVKHDLTKIRISELKLTTV